MELSKDRYQFSVADTQVQDLFILADRMPERAGLRGTVELVI